MFDVNALMKDNISNINLYDALDYGFELGSIESGLVKDMNNVTTTLNILDTTLESININSELYAIEGYILSGVAIESKENLLKRAWKVVWAFVDSVYNAIKKYLKRFWEWITNKKQRDAIAKADKATDTKHKEDANLKAKKEEYEDLEIKVPRQNKKTSLLVVTLAIEVNKYNNIDDVVNRLKDGTQKAIEGLDEFDLRDEETNFQELINTADHYLGELRNKNNGYEEKYKPKDIKNTIEVLVAIITTLIKIVRDEAYDPRH